MHDPGLRERDYGALRGVPYASISGDIFAPDFEPPAGETWAAFHARVDAVNQDLAAAHAADNGWEPSRVEAAARTAFAELRPGEEITDLALVQVIDPPGTDDDKAVFRVHSGVAEHHLTLARDRMAWVSWWITPKVETARRFDTRFFLAVHPHGQSSSHDDNETIASEWVRPADALERQRRGEMVMLPPTVTNLNFLAGFDSAEEALAAGRLIGTPPTILPKIRFAEDGSVAGIVMPGEPDYDELG